MTTRSFTVETRAQAVAIFGGPSALVTSLISELVSLGVYATPVADLSSLEELRASYDPDYLVLFSDYDYAPIRASLQSLIQSGESRLFVLTRPADPDPVTTLTPITRSIVFSDYVGETELGSPLITTWLKTAESDHSLALSGDGLGEFSLLGINDLAHLLALSILHPTTKLGEKLELGNPTPISPLNLAYFLRTNLAFKLDISFTQEEQGTDQSTHLPAFQTSLEKLSYQLLDSPQDFLKSYLSSHLKLAPQSPPPPRESAPAASVAPIPVPTPPPKKLTPLRVPQPVFVPLRPVHKLSFSLRRPRRLHTPRSLRISAIVGRGLLIALALYLGTIAFTATVSLLSLKRIFFSLTQNELPRQSRLNSIATTYLQANWLALTSLPGLSDQPLVKDTTLLFDLYNQALSVFDSARDLSHSAEELTSFVFGSGNVDIVKTISLSRLQAEELYQKLSLLDGALPPDPPSSIPAKYHPSYQTVKTKLTTLKRSVITAKALLATTPDIIGLGGRRKYAVLFQNNMELRATGGFIGSFAILSFENGKLYDMPLYDVYDADGQLKGHVEPPAPIKDILGEANWYLRDSNFDPDFPVSARRAEWFIKKSLNQDLDGTIAVTLNTLISLLSATGPLEISDYNETVSAQNLYEKAQFHAEVNFFPGSTQKKEFLSTVANSLFARLPSLGAGEGLKLLSALSDTVQSKDTLISLTKDTTNHVFETLGWNGQISDLPCPTKDACHKDYAMVVDSNFGVNKANYFIRRAIEEVITFDKDLSPTHTLRLRYQNTATSTAWPAGTYKNYQRLYLPIGSTITHLIVGDRQLEPSEYTITSEHNKAVVSHLLSVPINEALAVELQYTTPQLPQEKELLYTWYWQKQPGTSSDDSLVIYLNYPLYLKPTVISPTAELAPQQLKFDLTNDADHRVTVKFQR